MPTVEAPLSPTQKQIFVLSCLSDDELLLRAKADLLTSLATDVLTMRDVPSVFSALSRLLETIRVFREKSARAAGSKLAPIIAGMFSDGGDKFCKKINYCARRKELREKLAKIRNAITAAQVAQELVEIEEILATIIDVLANLKLPLSVIFLIFLYSLDVVCKCPPERELIARKPKKK